MIGAGGHAKVVVATAREAGFDVVGLLDDDPNKRGRDILGAPVLGSTISLGEHSFDGVVLAIGDNRCRWEFARRWPQLPWCSVVHPRACLHASSTVGPGTVVFAGAVVQPCVRIGAHTIVNTAAVVEHDCVVGDFCHLAPGTRLAGAAEVEEGAFLGIGAVVLPGKRIGAWSVVGAGAVVVHDIARESVAYGVPAKVKRPAHGGNA